MGFAGVFPCDEQETSTFMSSDLEDEKPHLEHNKEHNKPVEARFWPSPESPPVANERPSLGCRYPAIIS